MLKNYLKIALRNLRKHRGYTVINVAGLGVGLASCVLILLYVQDERSYDRFHANADRIVRVAIDDIDANGNVSSFARVGAPWGPALVQDFPEVETSVRFRFVGNVLFHRDDVQVYEGNGLFADPTVFDVFTLPFIHGTPETALAEPDALVLTETLAEKYFGDDDPIGQTLTIEDTDVTITGVVKDMPANSHFSFDFLRPFAVHAAQRPEWMDNWGRYNYHVYLLLSDAAAAEALQDKLPAFLQRHVDEVTAATTITVLQPLTRIHLHSRRSREFEANGSMATVYILSAIALFILLIACINFMNLATARSTSRAKEVGLRKVVGAHRRQLVGQFLGEAILVSFLALVVGLALVELLLPAFNTLTGKTLATHYTEAGLLPGLLLLGLVVGGLAGSYPAFFLSAFRPASVLKGDLPRGTRAARLRKSLVVAQFTISIVLLVGVGVVFEQLGFIQDKNLGFNKEQVVMIPMRDSNVRQNYETMKEAFVQHPNVLKAAASSGSLGGGDWGISIRAEGTSEEETLSTRMLCLDYDYLETMEMDLVAGRNLSEAFASDAEEAFLINEALAEQLGWDDPINRRLQVGGDWRKGAIVGVVKDFNFRSLHEAVDPMVMFFAPDNMLIFSVRIRSEDAGSALDHLRATWEHFAPERPFVYSFLDESFAQHYEADEQFGKVFGYFALLAVLIACLGLFGLASFTAEQRTKEIGIRKVLGASVGGIVMLLSKEFARLVGLALVLAAPLAYLAMTRWLETFAYRVDLSWQTFLLAGSLALAIALLTVSYQAIRAALADPVKALRYE